MATPKIILQRLHKIQTSEQEGTALSRRQAGLSAWTFELGHSPACGGVSSVINLTSASSSMRNELEALVEVGLDSG